MISPTTIAAIRFGYGLGPNVGATDAMSLRAGLASGNSVAGQYPVTSSTQILRKLQVMRKAQKAVRAEKPNAEAAEKAARKDLQNSAALGLSQGTARILDARSAFFERLSWFWADHFTAVGKQLPARAMAPAYLDEAIRPHVTARFGDMLKAVVSHPLMLIYLDQVASVGPNSPIGKRRNRGLNENLARELLELHSLGVDGDYGQGDVRQLAELLTGLSFEPDRGFIFNTRIAEPGAKTVLGKTYGGGPPTLSDIYQMLDDLAVHPDTARHIAGKLARHFVSDTPDGDMVEQMTRAYLATGGELMAVYSAMLEHPAAWAPLGGKAKQPFDFIVSGLVALGVTGGELLGIRPNDLRRLLPRPLRAMGQPFMQANGPDGWPEAAQAWITPQGLATRIAWSVEVSRSFAARVQDPAAFLNRTLADAAGEKLIWAVAHADTTKNGVALVFASAEFNRR
ncbi:MAG: DUF1800 domain-containing protein [Paracoccaceae bacterium]